MRRTRRNRYSSWSSVETMGSLPSPTRTRPPSRDTGFPPSFDGIRNTTLPHPDANLSPNASIDANDIALQRVLSRQKRSLLAKHKRTISHGMITPEMERTYSEPALLTEGETMSTVDSKRSEPSSQSKDERVSFTSSAGSGIDPDVDTGSNQASARNDVNSLEDGTAPKSRRSLFKRLVHR